jgi:hypothetical protein
MSLNLFCYDGQIRRFLYQFIKIMSHFQVEFGKDRDGNTALQQVPVFYGDASRQVAQILKGNTENALPSVPAMACYISALDYDRARVQEPYHVSKLHIRERDYNSTTDTWGHAQGDAFTVERLMPVPYKLTLKVDIWTSNTEQKLQIMEQMLPLFNPALEIQSTDNYIDWTSLSAIYLQSTTWSSRQVGTSVEDAIDVSSLTFELPIWLSLPAKVKKLGVIQRMIGSIYDANGDLITDLTDLPGTSVLARRVITPMHYGVIYFGNTLRLFHPHSIVTQSIDGVSLDLGDTFHWKTMVNMYGARLENGISEVRLEQPNGNTVVGTVSYHPTDATLLLFTPIVDTVPSNTLAAVNAIIDPFNMPVDSTYLNATVGDRYLILNDIGSLDNVEAAAAWHGTDGSDLVAKANDIIEFDGTRWVVSFAANGQPDVKYVTNIKSGLQFKWVPQEQAWLKSIEGKYPEGSWTIVLTA